MTNSSLKYEPQEIRNLKTETGKVQNTAPALEVLNDFKQEPDNEFADLVKEIQTFIFFICIQKCIFILGFRRPCQFHG